jgi:hypothetical protein
MVWIVPCCMWVFEDFYQEEKSKIKLKEEEQKNRRV